MTQPQRLFSFFRRALPDIAALCLLLLLVAGFFWRVWTPNVEDRVTFPDGDFTQQYYPLRHFVARSLAEGRLPFWNPYIFGGQPGLADPQAAALYPPSVLNALFFDWNTAPSEDGFPLEALELEAMGHIAWAANGTYLFVRFALGLGMIPALVAAVIFGFGGYLTGFPLDQITILETLAWFPWLLLTLHHARPSEPTPRRLISSALASVVVACALLAGHPQSAMYLIYLSGFYALLHFVSSPGRTTWRRLPNLLDRWVVSALPLFAPFVLGVSLAAAQLLSTLRFIDESSREVLEYNFVQSGLNWFELSELLFPKIEGSTPLYVGILTLLLAPLGLISSGRRVEKVFWGGAALVSLLLALGGNSILFDLLYLVLPYLKSVRSQERVLIIWGWSVALLAAWGMNALLTFTKLQKARLRRYVRWLATLIPAVLLPLLSLWALQTLNFADLEINREVFQPFFERYRFMVIIFLLGWGLFAWRAYSSSFQESEPKGPAQGWGGLRGGLLGLLILLVLIFDLFSITRAPHLGEPADQPLIPHNAIVDALHAWQGSEPGRIGIVGEPQPRGNDGMYWRLPLLTGNEPLRLARSDKLFEYTDSWRQLQLFGARYVVADFDLAANQPEAFEPLAEVISERPSYLVRTRSPMPYVWIVQEAELMSGQNAIYERLREPSFNPHAVGLVDREQPSLAANGGSVATFTIEEQSIEFVQVRVQNPADAPVLLVFAEPIANGWLLFLNGEQQRKVRVNAFNIGALVPAGEHVVTLRYEQPGWPEGIKISGATAIIVLMMLMGGLWGSAEELRNGD